jgi:hypothetical protein
LKIFLYRLTGWLSAIADAAGRVDLVPCIRMVGSRRRAVATAI